MAKKDHHSDDDPQWYKDAIIYETHVRAFFDSNDDGIGDFKGMTEKLDYLQSLGITALWLLPFYPSPLRDDGYDIADYYNVHPDYGTLKDFKNFLSAAHKRGIKVITELVINHTSSEHEWFRNSRHARPGSNAREFYVWSDTPDKYKDARIIFQDFESSNWSWDSIAQAYYWHRFYSHQPDLNFDNPAVGKAVFRALDFWLRMGVDGMRLDAVPYLFERDGTNCENLPETHEFLKKLRAHIDQTYKNKMLLAEANQWPEDAAAYFGNGDECHMAFHFPLMPRMFMAVQMEDSFPIIDILKSTPKIPSACEWAIFLRNHDELTLEMVTDEERDYMYRMYAKDPRARINVGIRRRLAPLLRNNRRKIELINILLFSLPGTPVLYYGDEIGMGDNYYLGDRNGVRTPMQWTPDRNAGFSKTNPQQLYLPVITDPEYHYEAINVETQDRNPSSLLWWMKRVIAMRKRLPALVKGEMKILIPSNGKVLAFTRSYQNETILVVANLSRFTQVLNLDLAEYEGYRPVEVFSLNEFPPIRRKPYVLTMSPYAHYWISLVRELESIHVSTTCSSMPVITTAGWRNVLTEGHKQKLASDILPGYLKSCTWFKAREKAIRKIDIVEDAIIRHESSAYHLLFLSISFNEGSPDTYFLPISLQPQKDAQRIIEDYPKRIITTIMIDNEDSIIYDSTCDESFHKALLTHILSRKRIRGKQGDFTASTLKKHTHAGISEHFQALSHPLEAEQHNSSVIYGKSLIAKLYRRIETGTNPELDITHHLSTETRFEHIPPFVGALEYTTPDNEPATVAIIQKYMEHTADAWTYTVDAVSGYFESVLSGKDELADMDFELPAMLDVDPDTVPVFMQDLLGGAYLQMAELLGKRTGELHLALAEITDSTFQPQAFSTLYQRSVCQSIQSLVRRNFLQIKKYKSLLPENIRKEAEAIASSEQKIVKRLETINQKKFHAMKIRIHGDYHLKQVLFTGKDFVIIDFEGEPARTLSERRLKHSPLKDAAGMIRSFHYAAYSALFLLHSVRPEDRTLIEKWIEPWHRFSSGAFMFGYLNTIQDSGLIPETREDLEALLQAFLIEKAVYEIGYELHNRPDWTIIPIRGINHIMKSTF
ncbi:MAG: maltose alpha-D-glucosyltransferase [Candidatus Auribacterota bacterium]